jgi:arginyl-tRNA--protein-N-Asp/Glu arginylyltransferase
VRLFITRQAAAYPPPKVVPPAPRLAARLPPGTAFTCATPHAIAAAAAAAASPSSLPSAAALAEQLARTLRLPGALPPEVTRVEAGGGYLNFICADADDDATRRSAAPLTPKAPHQPRRAATTDAISDAAGGAAAPAPSSPLTSQPASPPPRLSLEMRIAPSVFNAVEFDLYCRYQAAVHGEAAAELTEAAYTRFLVDTPLIHEPAAPDDADAHADADASAGGSAAATRRASARASPRCGFGSFHQQYWLGERLIAVGVVDVLPRCLSSKYLFWDPALAPLCLGKYSALAEIAWVAAQAAGPCPSLKHYYLGFYIHTCPKMRYKASYKPSQLLCPATRAWVPMPQAAPRLDACRYTRLAPEGEGGDSGDGDATEGFAAKAEALDACLLFFPSQGVARLGALAAAGALPSGEVGELRATLGAWRRVVGPAVASRAACVCWKPLKPPPGAAPATAGADAESTARRGAEEAAAAAAEGAHAGADA